MTSRKPKHWLLGSLVKPSSATRPYDSDGFLAFVEEQGMKPVIPSRTNRRTPRALDTLAYTRRNVIERLFGRINAFRWVATRYDKTAASYKG